MSHTPAPAEPKKQGQHQSSKTSGQASIASVLRRAQGDAFRGGVAGAASQVFNVGALMWMRTVMNYQYRYGGALGETLKKLYTEGGIRRYDLSHSFRV
jgi:hypothetical protein